MEISVRHMKDSRPIELVGLGDIHVGNINCDKAKFEEIVDWIAGRKRCYWIGTGDYIEAVLPSPVEWRYDTRTVDPYFWKKHVEDPNTSIIREEAKYIKEQLQKIAPKCLGLLEGNHEYKIWQRHHHAVVLDLSEELNVPYLGPSAYVILTFPNSKHITVYCLHGDYGGRKLGGAVNRLHDISLGYEADIYLMGHCHWVHGNRGIVGYVDFKGGKPVYKETKKCYVLTGAFLRAAKIGSESYIERKGLQPRKTGIAVIKIYPRRHDIHVQE